MPEATDSSQNLQRQEELQHAEEERERRPFQLIHADHLTQSERDTLEVALKAFSTVRYSSLPQNDSQKLRYLPGYQLAERHHSFSPSSGSIYQIDEVLVDTSELLSNKIEPKMKEDARRRIEAFYAETSQLEPQVFGQMSLLTVDCASSEDTTTPRQYAEIAETFQGYRHDLKGIFTTAAGFEDLIKYYNLKGEKLKEYEEKVASGKTRVAQKLAIAADELSGRLPKEQWNLDKFTTYLKTSPMIQAINMPVQVQGELSEQLSAISFSWSATSINSLIENICRNAREAKATQITISFKVEDDKTGKKLEIAFHDNGEGYPEKILESGFQSGLTIGKEAGTGQGMHYQGSILQRYKATLTPSNASTGGGITTVRFSLS